MSAFQAHTAPVGAPLQLSLADGIWSATPGAGAVSFAARARKAVMATGNVVAGIKPHELIEGVTLLASMSAVSLLMVSAFGF